MKGKKNILSYFEAVWSGSKKKSLKVDPIQLSQSSTKATVAKTKYS